MELSHIAVRGGRLSTVLKEEMSVSTGLMNRLKWQQKLFVNGISVHTDFVVHPGDVVSLPLDDPAPEYPAQSGPLSVLYEDDQLLVVDKPAGMLIHPSRVKLTDTLANFVLGHYHATGQNCAFHPVTRLDRDTFGIVLLAKNAHTHTLLQAAPPHKHYHALVFGGPETDCGTIDAPIARRPLPSLLRYVHPEGKPSVSEFTVLERLEGCCKLELRPITGRTHQLRLHCSHMGFPVLGDPQYGTEASRAFSARLGIKSQQLCAYSLELTNPITGARLYLTSHLDTCL